MSIIWTLIIGLVVGALAKLIMPGKDPGGIIVTMLLGVAGSLVASFIGHAFGWYRSAGSGPGVVMSVVGALILLGIYRLAIRRRSVV
ncbi:MAG TPA: GlsB/YeaQ/YmgE family stress response membrane protein [Polyangia bacterium]|nr:GlsB/YeaQ/YmgE family stress response membrane protein [Polyangia bacterium]